MVLNLQSCQSPPSRPRRVWCWRGGRRTVSCYCRVWFSRYHVGKSEPGHDLHDYQHSHATELWRRGSSDGYQAFRCQEACRSRVLKGMDQNRSETAWRPWRWRRRVITFRRFVWQVMSESDLIVQSTYLEYSPALCYQLSKKLNRTNTSVCAVLRHLDRRRHVLCMHQLHIFNVWWRQAYGNMDACTSSTPMILLFNQSFRITKMECGQLLIVHYLICWGIIDTMHQPSQHDLV